MSLTQQQQFLRNEALGSSIRAASPRPRTLYRAGATEADKKSFRCDMRSKLVEFGNKYRECVTSDDHLKNIDKLLGFLCEKEMLEKENITFGVAQKMLNLYLKYEWCHGMIPEPPHCPIDSKVLKKVENDSKIKWTEMLREEYISAMFKIKKHAEPESVGEWELRVFNEENDAYCHS